MNRNWVLAFAIQLCLVNDCCFATGGGSVELLQAPAWLLRDNVRSALALDSQLRSGDRIETSKGSRIVLRLDEGSTVKLGANAQFVLTELDDSNGPDGIFKGFLDVLKGAFRFTTTKVGEHRRRDIRARVRTATIGIRGTDVWGKTEDERDFVVLLEGRIEIERDNNVFVLDQALSLFMAPRGSAPDPIGPVNQDELARWAQETEPQAGQGIQQHTGTTRLHLATHGDAASALALQARLALAGYAATVSSLTVGGREWHHTSLAQFASAADATATLDTLQLLEGFGAAWIEARNGLQTP